MTSSFDPVSGAGKGGGDGASVSASDAHAEAARVPAQISTQISAFGTVTKRLGNWTSERNFQVRAHRGVAVLDLRSPRIPEGDITVDVELDHSTLKLLLPEDAQIDDWDLRRFGRSHVKDGQRPQWPGSRRIVLTGRLAGAEIRVRRGGVAIVSAMLSREYLTDLRTSHRLGTVPTVDDPARLSWSAHS